VTSGLQLYLTARVRDNLHRTPYRLSANRDALGQEKIRQEVRGSKVQFSFSLRFALSHAPSNTLLPLPKL